MKELDDFEQSYQMAFVLEERANFFLANFASDRSSRALATRLSCALHVGHMTCKLKFEMSDKDLI